MGNFCALDQDETLSHKLSLRNQTEEDFTEISSRPIDIITDIKYNSYLSPIQVQKRLTLKDFNLIKVIFFLVSTNYDDRCWVKGHLVKYCL